MDVVYAGGSLFKWMYVCVDVSEQGSGPTSEREVRRGGSTDRGE